MNERSVKLPYHVIFDFVKCLSKGSRSTPQFLHVPAGRPEPGPLCSEQTRKDSTQRRPVRRSPTSKTCQPENECFLVKGYDITILNFISPFSLRGKVSERGQRGGGGRTPTPLCDFLYVFILVKSSDFCLICSERSPLLLIQQGKDYHELFPAYEPHSPAREGG